MTEKDRKTGRRTNAVTYVTPEELDQQLKALSREPFRQLLNRVLESQPDTESLKEFARQYPDRWGQLLSIVSRQAGYHDKLDIDVTVTQRVQSMSDAELIADLEEMDRKLESITIDQIPEKPESDVEGGEQSAGEGTT